MSKFETMPFYARGCDELTNIVGKKSLFKDKQAFLNWALNDCEELDEFLSEESEVKERLTAEDVKEGFVRYYPNMPEGFDIKSGYTFCGNEKGAFEVYYIDFN
jgi:hypothetical protein